MNFPLLKAVIQRLNDGKLDVRFHTATGALQVYITDDIRLHVYHPELLPVPGAFGSIHDHRFSFTSIVVMGMLLNTIYTISAHAGTPRFNWRTFEVQHALVGASEPILLDFSCQLRLAERKQIHAGEAYCMCRGDIHETRAHGLTISLMWKYHQLEAPACIFAQEGQKPEHILDNQPSKTLMLQLVHNALRRCSPEDFENALDKIYTEVSKDVQLDV